MYIPWSSSINRDLAKKTKFQCFVPIDSSWFRLCGFWVRHGGLLAAIFFFLKDLIAFIMNHDLYRWLVWNHFEPEQIMGWIHVEVLYRNLLNCMCVITITQTNSTYNYNRNIWLFSHRPVNVLSWPLSAFSKPLSSLHVGKFQPFGQKKWLS